MIGGDARAHGISVTRALQAGFAVPSHAKRFQELAIPEGGFPCSTRLNSQGVSPLLPCRRTTVWGRTWCG